MMSDFQLRWHVFWARRKSDTKTRFLMELGRCVARAVEISAPLLEIGTRAGGSALLMCRIARAVTRPGFKPPLVMTVDPYGARPYEGEHHIYDEQHYVSMKRTLASYPNHIHYMMDSELFLRVLGQLYLWMDGHKQPIDRFSLVYLEGSHNPEVVWHEITELLPRVVPGGFLIVDDTDWFDGAVRRGLEAAAPSLPVRLRHNGKQTIVKVFGKIHRQSVA